MMLTENFLIAHQHWYSNLKETGLKAQFKSWLSDPSIQTFLGVNRYQDVVWYNKERFEEFLWWLRMLALLEITAENYSTSIIIERLLATDKTIAKLERAGRKSNFQVELLIAALKE